VVNTTGPHQPRLVQGVGRARVDHPGVAEDGIASPAAQLDDPDRDAVDVRVCTHETLDPISTGIMGQVPKPLVVGIKLLTKNPLFLGGDSVDTGDEPGDHPM